MTSSSFSPVTLWDVRTLLHLAATEPSPSRNAEHWGTTPVRYSSPEVPALRADHVHDSTAVEHVRRMVF